MTNEEVLAEFNKAQERIKPAKLADTPANGLALSAYMLKHNLLPPTAGNFYAAVNALIASPSLEWDVKPSKLLSAERNSVQSVEETLRLFDEYQRSGDAPPDLIFDAGNAKAMLDFVISKWGIVSITYLREAEKLLGSKLKRQRLPTAAEIEAGRAKRLEAKMRKDYLDSIAPQKTLVQQKEAQERLDANKVAAIEKEHKTVLSRIEFEVSNYTKGHASGATNWSATESGRESLRKTRDEHNLRTLEGAQRALDAVRTAKFRLP